MNNITLEELLIIEQAELDKTKDYIYNLDMQVRSSILEARINKIKQLIESKKKQVKGE